MVRMQIATSNVAETTVEVTWQMTSIIHLVCI